MPGHVPAADQAPVAVEVLDAERLALGDVQQRTRSGNSWRSLREDTPLRELTSLDTATFYRSVKTECRYFVTKTKWTCIRKTQ